MIIAGSRIGTKTFVIAEIGINHNGDVGIAKELIFAAKNAGCDAVKFQKRTIDIVYTPEELAAPRESPFGKTNGDLKRGLELSSEAYREIDLYCRELGIIWFASPWDESSVGFLEEFNVPCYKIAAASLTDAGLLNRIKSTGKPVLMSVGMSELSEIDKAVDIIGKENLLLFYCKSLYPATPEKLDLNVIKALAKRYGVPIGYSGHEQDTIISATAVALGAVAVERHLTLDRGMWGSDHKASINPAEMKELIENIRLVEQVLGDGVVSCLPEEVPVKNKLRRVNSL